LHAGSGTFYVHAPDALLLPAPIRKAHQHGHAALALRTQHVFLSTSSRIRPAPLLSFDPLIHVPPGPYLDMLNHASSLGGSRLAYEYFADSFTASLDPKARPVRKGEQVMISYGERSNDQLLQYYGFVETGNPHDAFVLKQEDFLLALAEAKPFSPSRLQRLKEAKVADPTARITLERDGSGARALQVARLLYLEEDIIVEDGARAAEDAQGAHSEKTVRGAIALAAKLLLSKLEAREDPTKAGNGRAAGRGFGKNDDKAVASGARALALAFRAEKAAVLRDCIAVLER